MLIEKTFTISFKIDFKGNEEDLKKLKKMIDYHIHYLLDIDDPTFANITSIYDANLKEVI